VKRWFIITVFVMGCVNMKSLILATLDVAYPLIREAVTDGLSSMDASASEGGALSVDASTDQ